MSDYPAFLNGKDLPQNQSFPITVNKVKRFVNDKSETGFAGFFIEVDTPDGKRTISASFGSVLEDMLMQKLEGVSFDLFRYDKGDKSYLSTQKPKSSNQTVQQPSNSYGATRRYGR